MMKLADRSGRIFGAVVLLLVAAPMQAQVIREYKISKNYLNFPIDEKLPEREDVTFIMDKDTLLQVEMRLADGIEDYWVFKDVSAYKGKTIQLHFVTEHPAIDRIFQSNEFPGQDSLYHEKYRPQFHFSSRRGWHNDPNGMIWYDGEYHLFYQHDPFEARFGNVHWGHAVSKDMLHWKELDDALLPDSMGRMYSGSAVIDKENTAGFGKNTMIAAYTAAGDPKYVQCIAYSHDKGRTFTKYEGNPVVDNMELAGLDRCRDPKVFWHEPTQKWVMVVLEDSRFSIYNSSNLKDWEFQSSIDGFYECPDFFELPVDGNPAQMKWVMMGASGTYMIGSFDGHRFTPEFGKYPAYYGNRYAGQTFSNQPDGRVIQMGWARDLHYPGMPFNQQMNIPLEFSLKNTREGIRLYSQPIREIESLHGKKYAWNHLVGTEMNEKLKSFQGKYFHLKADVELINSLNLEIYFKGCPLVHYQLNYNQMNGIHYVMDDFSNRRFQVEILVDARSVETFIDGGKLHLIHEFDEKNEDGLVFLDSEDVMVHSLVLYEMNSIWD